jgi:ectoine hydroxylase
MEPSRLQLEQFKRDGFLHLPGLFSAREARALKREALRLSAPAKENTLEPGGSTVRAALGVQQRSALFASLARHPRLVLVARRLLGGEVYLHQLKVNYKVAFDGAAWDWHQDFDTWHRVDGMPRPEAVTAALLLDEVTAVNGPLMFIPGSHKRRLSAVPCSATPGYLQFALGTPTVRRLVERYGIVASTGAPGSVVFFHANMAHASGSNLSPWGRTVAFVCLNRVRNRIRRQARPEWVSSRDFTPLSPLPDDCLLNFAANLRKNAP